jgi:opacity protein-like surface antigen
MVMRTVFISAAMLAAQITTAATPIDGWYGSVFGGYAYLPSNVTKTWGGVTWSEPTYHAGFDAGGSFGFKSNPLRYEGELSYINAGLSHFKVNGVAQTGVNDGYSEAFLAMANIYYDFPECIQSIQPFLGVGLGYGWISTKLNSQGPFGPMRFTGSNSVFAYQPTAGLTFNFAENYALTLAYKYVGTDRADELGKLFQAHIANIGIVYRFNEVSYK